MVFGQSGYVLRMPTTRRLILRVGTVALSARAVLGAQVILVTAVVIGGRPSDAWIVAVVLAVRAGACAVRRPQRNRTGLRRRSVLGPAPSHRR